mgnify:CR=1
MKLDVREYAKRRRQLMELMSP